MKKILLLIIVLMSSITMYFIVFWEPGGTVVDTGMKNVNEENKINEKTKVVVKEEEKIENKRFEEEKQAMEKYKEEEKNKNFKIIKKISTEINKEDKLQIENILNELSTVDLMQIRKNIEEGNLEGAKKIINERLLNEESNIVFEILGKYK